MNKSGKVAYICFISVIVLLVAALAFSGFTIHKKNQHIADIKDQIASNEAEIKEKNETISGLEEKLSGSEQEKAKVKSELDAAKTEKDKLQKENSSLKKEIENLKAKKQAEIKAQAAVNAAPKPTVQQTVAGNKVCYLTFDDGPSKRTLEILEILKRYNVKATFFVINTSNFDYIKQIHAQGHTIGLHCYDHVYSKIYKNVDAYFADLNAISQKVQALTGVKSTVIRFPGGSSNMVSSKYSRGIMTTLSKEVGKRGYSYFDWNVSSGDAESVAPSYTKIVNNVLSGARGKNSICVLMHDASAKTTTVQALPKIIEGLRAQGFTFAGLTPQTFGFHHGVNN